MKDEDPILLHDLSSTGKDMVRFWYKRGRKQGLSREEARWLALGDIEFIQKHWI